MRRLAVLLLALALPALGAQPADAVVKRPDARPTATGAGGSAATVDPYATKAAIDVLRRGGNAVDAAVAAAGVLGVVEPYSAGIGGGGFMVIRRPGGQVVTIDGREFAPRAFTKRSLLRRGTKRPLNFDRAVTSGLGVGVPGTPDTWRVALRRYGTRSLAAMLRPGIRVAARGFRVDRTLRRQTLDNRERFALFPATARLYLPGGRPIRAGSVLRNPDMASTYRRMARLGTARGFYRGPVARDLIATVRDPAVRRRAKTPVPPGLMRAGDLRAYRALSRPALRTRWRGLTVAGMAPPSSGGTTVLEALNVLEAFGAPATSTTQGLHRYLEASRRAFADRGAYLGDPRFVDVPVKCLLSQDFADARRDLIAATAPDYVVPPGACTGAKPARVSTAKEGPNTTHLTVADRRGTVVSYTFTIEQTGGSGMVVPGRGFLLNNELTDFDFEPGTPNEPGPRKRPRSSMSPTIVLRDGKPVLALGSPGGSTIITTVLQVLFNRFERGQALPQAVAAPRVTQQNAVTALAEPGFLRLPAAERLRRLGHRFSKLTDDGGEIGAVAGIEFLPDGRQQAVAEPRRRGGGSAMVVSP